MGEFTAAEREFLLRGGTATFDDFHGPLEWDNFASEMKRVFPDRPIIDLTDEHPIFHSVFDLPEMTKVAIPHVSEAFGGGRMRRGPPRWQGIEDEDGRLKARPGD